MNSFLKKTITMGLSAFILSACGGGSNNEASPERLNSAVDSYNGETITNYAPAFDFSNFTATNSVQGVWRSDCFNSIRDDRFGYFESSSYRIATYTESTITTETYRFRGLECQMADANIMDTTEYNYVLEDYTIQYFFNDEFLDVQRIELLNPETNGYAGQHFILQSPSQNRLVYINFLGVYLGFTRID